jgi:undecaprenyl-diphosphatase
MFQAIILGIVQGITEFLPVSSTAHLILFPWFFHWGGILDTLTFDIALHAGTLAALLLYFWKDWLDLLLRKQKLFALIVVATVPAAIAGVLFNDIVERTLRSPYIICASLVAVGIVMLASEKMYKHKSVEQVSLLDSVFVGIAQALALIPGVSRSGVTISAGLFRGLDREASARFSFLLATPVVAGAVALHARKILGDPSQYDLRLFMAGFLASALTGFVAIRFLLGFFRRHTVNGFAYYRFFLAAVIMISIWLRG